MIALEPARAERFLAACTRVVGADNIAHADEASYAYADALAPRDPLSYAPRGAVMPATAEEVQAIVRLANEQQVALWPISRGKNLGYGGAAPHVADAVMLDLARMKRILEINVEQGYAVLEPGVSFDDLIRHLADNRIPLWTSAAAHTWGSVVGNALERGVGYTPYGDHASKVCGMEIVTPTGEFMRTGMGAMEHSASWHLFPYGFGPSWDGAFMQSNFGVVTKMGLWLMPEPAATLNLAFKLNRVEDLPAAVDVLRPLKLNGTIQANPSIGNAIRSLATRGPRSAIFKGAGPMPADTLDAARKAAGLGHWNFAVRLFGDPRINAINAATVRDAFAGKVSADIEQTEWHRGEDLARSGAPVPSLGALGVVDWLGGPGGHLTFSPVSAFTGAEAWKQYSTIRRMFEAAGFDYYGGFTAGPRYLNHITMILFNRADAEMMARANRLFADLIRVGAENGWGEYRTHTLWYDDVARSYAFNGNAMTRWNEQVKDAVDPKGILAPGKMGIWPRRYRERRS